MSAGRPWLALVAAAFCLPLFVGLGTDDVRGDEAIYSFGVDRLLESGDWLAPKSSPREEFPFLEKPPLKFWIVAAPIAAGLLPHDEFGLRFWDALFSGLAFLYVFATGTRMAGPICGAVAVFALFVHRPLLFEHGLRTNNMEAPLFLAYCGGMYHFLAWTAHERRGPQRLHAAAVGLYFVLGFMTKFVAVLFLPAVIAATTVLFHACRAKALRERRLWLAVAALATGLIAPWFLYAQLRFGGLLWETMLAEHVYTRFTTSLDPSHLEPWSYYLTRMNGSFASSGFSLIVIGGLLALLVMSVRRRWAEGSAILLWWALPAAVLSLGTSKLYHYFYPFLPPLALAAGYLVALPVLVAPAPVDRVLRLIDEKVRWMFPGVVAWARRPPARGVLSLVALLALTTTLATLVVGPLRISLGGLRFRNASIARPLLLLVAAGLLLGTTRTTARWLVALLVASVLPFSQYRATWDRLSAGRHPMRSARDCVLQVKSTLAPTSPGVLFDRAPEATLHELYYYFRQVQPMTLASDSVSSSSLDRYLFSTEDWRPVLVADRRYQQYRTEVDASGVPRRASQPSPSLIGFGDALLLLPGPYSRCVPGRGAKP
jgi:4-amino-4-deoxy-L-arabinose transferase-like glycosyltransferase